MLTEPLPTERFVLACLDQEHVDDGYVTWMNDPLVTRYLETRHSPVDAAQLSAYVADIRASTHSYLFGIFEAEGGRHVGNIKLGPVSAAHRTASVGLIIGERDVWGRGVATEAVTAVTRWAFGTLRLAKLTAGSYASNGGSIGAFVKAGYRVEGRQLSQVELGDGTRDDVVLLGAVPEDVAA